MQDSRPTARTMPQIDEMFMFLKRIRVRTFEKELSDQFLIHISTVSRKNTTWANFLLTSRVYGPHDNKSHSV